MFPPDFQTKFVGRTQQQRKDGTHNISEIPGVIGIDGSGMIYNALKTELGSAVFDVSPKVPLYNAKQKFVKDINCVTRNDREAIMFLDGRPHLVKRAGENRTSRQEAMQRLCNEYNLGPLANYERVKSLRKQCVFRRDDFTLMIIDECGKRGIKVFCAPFEADWQLVAAQQAGIIDNIITDDGDLFVIGGDNIIMTEVNYYTGRCCFYKRSEVL
jgi:5'-3' exonuclease